MVFELRSTWALDKTRDARAPSSWNDGRCLLWGWPSAPNCLHAPELDRISAKAMRVPT